MMRQTKQGASSCMCPYVGNGSFKTGAIKKSTKWPRLIWLLFGKEKDSNH